MKDTEENSIALCNEEDKTVLQMDGETVIALQCDLVITNTGSTGCKLSCIWFKNIPQPPLCCLASPVCPARLVPTSLLLQCADPVSVGPVAARLHVAVCSSLSP